MPAPSPRLPRSRTATRPADCGYAVLRRIIFIHERLGNSHSVNAVSLAGPLEVSPRTIKRDIAFMRDQLGAPIAWEPATGSYSYTRECDLLPLLRLDAAEALALMLAGHTFASWRGSALGRALTTALGKIAGVVGGAVSLPVSTIGDLIFQPEEGPDADAERRCFAVALEAIRRRRVLSLVYQKPQAGAAPERREVHPLHLAYLDHRWVLIAHDPGRAGIRNFLLARIRKAHATSAIFSRPAGFDAATYLRGSLGRFTGEKETEVRLVFDAAIVPYVRERPWHATQVLRDLPGGACEATFRLNNLVDVRRRILACGRQVEVLAPSELRADLAAEAAAMAARLGQERTERLKS